MSIYTADKYDRMHGPENVERPYSVELDGKTYHVRACSWRGAQLRAEAQRDAEQGDERRRWRRGY